jgi:hypothetical protein
MTKVEIGFQAFVSDGGEEFGAVRDVRPNGDIVVYVENGGDYNVPAAAVHAVHAGKVVFDCAKLDARLRAAIGHAHDGEVPGL